jgi:hypothetical protein
MVSRLVFSDVGGIEDEVEVMNAKVGREDEVQIGITNMH